MGEGAFNIFDVFRLIKQFMNLSVGFDRVSDFRSFFLYILSADFVE